MTWLVIAACLAVYFLWQPSPFADDVEDAQFSYRYAAIPCEVVERRPLTIDEVLATNNLGEQDACGVDLGDDRVFAPDKNPWLAVLTSMFLHGGIVHLAGNLLFLWVFGNNIEDRLGRIGFPLFYVAGGIVATLTYVVLNMDSTVPLVGASGAIAAVMGAYLVWFPNARVRTLVFVLLIFFVDVRAKWLLGFWFVLQFLTSPNEGVAWTAHVGGFVFGVVIALLLRPRLALPAPAAGRGAYGPGGWRPPPAPPWDEGGFGGRRW